MQNRKDKTATQTEQARNGPQRSGGGTESHQPPVADYSVEHAVGQGVEMPGVALQVRDPPWLGLLVATRDCQQLRGEVDADNPRAEISQMARYPPLTAGEIADPLAADRTHQGLHCG